MFSFLHKLMNIRVFGTLHTTEEKIGRVLTPSDYLVGGLLFAIMAFGAGITLTEASIALSEEVPMHAGTYREGVVGTPRFINPLLATSETDRDVTALVYGGLMKQEPDGSVSPYLAERYEISEDGLQYTFYLRENMFFHDGTPITAEDVVYTVQTAKNPEIKSPRRANWEGVEVVAVDPKTVIFSLRAPYALFIENTVIGILPKHLWSNIPLEGFAFSDLNTAPVGSGMFRISSIKKNQSGIPSEYVLTAFDDSPKKPYIQTFVFKFYPNHTSLVQAFQNGDIDGGYSLILEKESNAVFQEAVFARVFGVFFNQNQQELFADAVVREALDRAIDKKRIIDTVLSGYGSPLSGPLPPDRAPLRESSETPVHSLEEARGILEKAGWVRGDDGVYTKTVKKETMRLQFSLTTANAPELRLAAELVGEMWKELGAEVSLQFFEQNDLNVDVLRPRKYDALLFGLVVGRELDLFAFWHSTQRNDPGLNIGLYANIETDRYLEEARNELDIETRREKARLAASDIAEETAAVFLYAPHFTYAHTPALRGVELYSLSAPSDRFAGIERWFVRTERVWPIFIE